MIYVCTCNDVFICKIDYIQADFSSVDYWKHNDISPMFTFMRIYSNFTE